MITKVKRKKLLFIVMYVILALPIPLSLITWLGSIISVANFGMLDLDNMKVLITAIISAIAMLLAGTYPVTYILALTKTLKNKKLSYLSFSPIVHIILTILFIQLWAFSEKFAGL